MKVGRIGAWQTCYRIKSAETPSGVTNRGKTRIDETKFLTLVPGNMVVNIVTMLMTSGYSCGRCQ